MKAAATSNAANGFNQMPILKNARHELFAQNLANGMSQQDAYTKAGYKGNRFNASDLATKSHIKERVAELQTRNVTKADEITEITTARLLAMAEEARLKAMELGQPASAVTAITAIAKLSGLWVERSEQTTKTVDPTTLTDAELAAIVKGSTAEPDKTRH